MKALFLACVLAASGALFASLLAPSYAWYGLGVGAVLGLNGLFTTKERQVVLRIGSLTWTMRELCRHFLITGDTGSGKTMSGINPILDQLTRNAREWGGLVLGVKGDEFHFMKNLTKKYGREHDLIHLQVRPPDAPTDWKPPHRYNLLSDRSIPWTSHAKMIVDIAASLTEGTPNPFFRPMAQIAIANAFELLDLVGMKVTLKRAYELLTSREAAKKVVKLLSEKPQTERSFHLIEFFETTFISAQSHEQTEGIQGTIQTFLEFYLHEDIASVFSSDEDNTFSFAGLERGQIVTVTIPQVFATERRYIQTYLKMLFYLTALRRFDRQPEQRQDEILLLLVADEFQELVTTSEDGMSDHKVVDRIRSAKACVIAAMQSEISVDPVIAERKREVLALNMRSRMAFRAADPKGAELTAQFIGKHYVWKKSYTSKGLLGRTVTRRRELDYIVQPTAVMKLQDHQAIVVHPSKSRSMNKLKPCFS